MSRNIIDDSENVAVLALVVVVGWVLFKVLGALPGMPKLPTLDALKKWLDESAASIGKYVNRGLNVGLDYGPSARASGFSNVEQSPEFDINRIVDSGRYTGVDGKQYGYAIDQRGNPQVWEITAVVGDGFGGGGGDAF